MEAQSSKRKSRQPPAVLPATRALGSPNSAALALPSEPGAEQ